MESSMPQVSPPTLTPETNSTPPVQKRAPFFWIFSAVVLLGIICYLGYQNWQLRNTSLHSELTVIPSISPVAVTNNPERILFIRDNNLWMYEQNKEVQLTKDGQPNSMTTNGVLPLWYGNPSLSPDKKQVAFFGYKSGNPDYRYLYTINFTNGNTEKTLATDVEETFTRAIWSSDSVHLYYLSPKSKFSETKILKQIDVTTGSIQNIGEYTIRSGCGGGSPDPADHLTWSENLGGWPNTFTVSPDGTYLIHNINCTGKGIGIFDLKTKSDLPLDDKGWGVVLSPDLKTFAFISGTAINIYDAGTRKILKTLSPALPPSSLLFSPDSQTIYYTGTKDNKTLTFDDSVAIDVVGMGTPTSYRILETSVWAIPISSGKSNKITSLDAHNGRLFYINSLTNTIVLAAIDNATDLFQYYSTYKTQKGSESHYPKTNIVEINMTSGEKQTMIQNAQQAAF